MKKVLIITYYWPPAGGPGVQRILKFAKYLPQFGWEPIVLTVNDGDYPAHDDSLVKEIPQNCKVYKSKALEPFGLYKKFTGKHKNDNIPTFILNADKSDNFKNKIAKWIRINFFIPDARIGWIPFAVRKGREIIKNEKIDMIFSSSPPQSLQIIAKKLSKKSKIRWIADFRDPWTEAFWASDQNKNYFAQRLDLALEKSVLKEANAITTVSPGVQSLFSQKVKNNYHVIHSGFGKQNNKILNVDKFIILFFGHLSKFQDPEPLLNSIDNISQDKKQNIEICFVGKIFEDHLLTFKKYKNLNIAIKNYMPYTEIMKFALKASLLFRPMAKSFYLKGSLGTKMFDYMALRKPVLSLGLKDNLSSDILNYTESGEIFEYNNIQGIVDFIEKIYEEWKINKHVKPRGNSKLNEFSTETNVKKLAKIFESTLVR